MIADKLLEAAALQHPQPQEATRVVVADAERKREPKTVRAPEDFFQLSQNAGTRLKGVACANLKNVAELLFFDSEESLEQSRAQVVPIRRIKSVELHSDLPIENSPLELPSMWRITIHLHPKEAAREEMIVTVFESEF
ncbi:MAG: hypothetical protein AAF483_20035 [Planctomycetota bacterium]